MLDFKKVLKSAVSGRSDGYAASSAGAMGWKEGYGAAGEQIESFYQALEEGLRCLESSLPQDSLSFRVEWLQVAVGFLQRIHSSTFLLVEKLWLPVRSISSRGPEFLNEYLDVSISLLEMCNNLREGLNHMESYHLSLELALRRLISASESLLQKGRELGYEFADSTYDTSIHLKPLNEARQELERLDSSMSVSQARTWVRFVESKKLASPPRRTVSVHLPPVSPGKKKKRDVSLVLYDVQVVTSFVSCVLLWVLTGQSGHSDPVDFSSNVDALEPSPKLQRTTSWSTFMFRLKEKVLAQSIQDLQNSSCYMKLQDVSNFQKSLALLRAEVNAGLKEGKLGTSTAFSQRITKQLEQQKQDLEELSGRLESISAQLNDMRGEIMAWRKKVLDTFERSVYH